MRVRLPMVIWFGVCTLVFLVPSMAAASQTNGTIDAIQKYAWGENIGWINFGVPSGNVHVTDAGLSGHAWSEQYGWINLDPSTAGVTNNGEGLLGGNAWSEWFGWIDFGGVTINSSGVFSGYATIETDNSRISFNCSNTNSCGASDFKVATDWRPASSRSSGGGGGGGGGSGVPVPTPTPSQTPTTQDETAIDIIRDGVVDILDFNALMVHWGSTECGNIADVTEDCTVDVLDFNTILVYWGTTYEL